MVVIFNTMEWCLLVVSHPRILLLMGQGCPPPKAAEKGKAATNAPNNKQPGEPMNQTTTVGWETRNTCGVSRVFPPWRVRKNGGCSHCISLNLHIFTLSARCKHHASDIGFFASQVMHSQPWVDEGLVESYAIKPHEVLKQNQTNLYKSRCWISHDWIVATCLSFMT